VQAPSSDLGEAHPRQEKADEQQRGHAGHQEQLELPTAGSAASQTA